MGPLIWASITAGSGLGRDDGREPAGRHLARTAGACNMNEWIDPRQLELEEPEEPVRPGKLDARAELQRMNERFIRAMAAAIRAGLERPERVGIDRTPGTKNPSYLRPSR